MGGGVAPEPPLPTPGGWLLARRRDPPCTAAEPVSIGQWESVGIRSGPRGSLRRTIPGKEDFLSSNIGLGRSLQLMSEGGTAWQSWAGGGI